MLVSVRSRTSYPRPAGHSAELTQRSRNPPNRASPVSNPHPVHPTGRTAAPRTPSSRPVRGTRARPSAVRVPGRHRSDPPERRPPPPSRFPPALTPANPASRVSEPAHAVGSGLAERGVLLDLNAVLERDPRHAAGCGTTDIGPSTTPSPAAGNTPCPNNGPGFSSTTTGCCSTGPVSTRRRGGRTVGPTRNFSPRHRL